MLMTLMPKSMLARTALVMLIALIASQALSVYLFRYYSREPRVQLAAVGFMTQMRTIRTALSAIPADQHSFFLQRLREEGGVRVIRPRVDEDLQLAPDFPALRVLREKLKAEFGTEADVYLRPQPRGTAPAQFVVKIDADGVPFWVVFPRSRVAVQDFSWAWVGWASFGALMTLFGSVFLVSRVTKPLRALADTARALGQGQNPAPVAELGPSEVKSVAIAFNQMREDLQRVEQERATFLAGISHDLRSPLTRLRLALEMLPVEKPTRADMERDIDDINAVIEQFLDFGRDETSEAVELVDVNLLVREAAGRRGSSFALELGDVTPISLRPLAVARVLANLLDNARKHGGGEITVRTQGSDNQVVISVLDRGAGIAGQDAERLKQPFTRFSEARSGASGAGLGLAIVERIARIHHGRFELLPRSGGGLEARVTLTVG
jgi:two-component system osmolarity sensor histidine kinase EnvZ